MRDLSPSLAATPICLLLNDRRAQLLSDGIDIIDAKSTLWDGEEEKLRGWELE
jgi:hypothetical protein